MAMYDPVDMKSKTSARTLAIASPLRGMPSAFSMISIFPEQTGQRCEDKQRKKADAVLYRIQEDGIEIIHGRIQFIGLVIKVSH